MTVPLETWILKANFTLHLPSAVGIEKIRRPQSRYESPDEQENPNTSSFGNRTCAVQPLA
jgi:hypothetical protein